MIVFTGGGTGGHLRIIDSVCEYVEDRVYIGSIHGQDRAWFSEDTRFKSVYFLKTTGVVNKKGFAKFKALWLLLKAVIKALSIVRKSDGVFSVGGFSAAPAALAAIVLRKPLYIHEQNSIEGKLNTLLKPFATHYFTSFGQGRVDYPVKEEFFQHFRKRKEVKTIIFLGGSQGAHAVNAIALKVASSYPFKIIHQCGEKDYTWLHKEYMKMGTCVDLFCFSDDVAKKMEEADFAVARAGASTLWELCANGLPTLFIPYPHAAQNHQYYNAKFLVDQEAAWVMSQEEFDLIFFEDIDKKIDGVSEKLQKQLNVDGAKQIASYLTR
ncbi:MAG: UDP-N-acetylglucosamine--N-acetylmuramyl-(pentapeptide) pyrophosphoryl-undecaprenol N-acetylglucosamine transferase [Campylobacterota bacterium]